MLESELYPFLGKKLLVDIKGNKKGIMCRLFPQNDRYKLKSLSGLGDDVLAIDDIERVELVN